MITVLNKNFLEVSEVADKLQINVDTTRRYIKKGLMRTSKVGSKLYISEEEILKFVEQGTDE